MKHEKKSKTDRILKLFFQALKGESLSVTSLADENHVSTRSITRDINDLKAFLANYRDILGHVELRYSTLNHSYSLEMDNLLTNKELFAIAKVLIGCRAFKKEELLTIINNMIKHTGFSDKEKIEKLIANDLYVYPDIDSNCTSVIEQVWVLSSYIHERQAITIDYFDVINNVIAREHIIPVSILFSEYYFYLFAHRYEHGKFSPKRYRVDRIINTTVQKDKSFNMVPQNFDEYFSFNQSLISIHNSIRTIRFEFTGASIQDIIDRLPTARLIEKSGDTYTFETEVYSTELKTFLLSLGSQIKVISPQDIVNEIRELIKKMQNLY